MEMEPHPAVVVITAFGDVALAVEAMKIGASDFVTKPWDNDDLKAKLRRAIADNRKRRDDRDLLAEAQELRSAAATKSRMTLDELKASHIKEVIDDCGGNLSLGSHLVWASTGRLSTISSASNHDPFPAQPLSRHRRNRGLLGLRRMAVHKRWLCPCSCCGS